MSEVTITINLNSHKVELSIEEAYKIYTILRNFFGDVPQPKEINHGKEPLYPSLPLFNCRG